MSGINLAQTFFIDPDAAQQAASIYVTSIDLFFYAKPTQGKAQSGINSPGVTIYLGDTSTDGSPNLTSFKRDVVARVEYANINVDTNGATATTFTFSRPVNLRTNVTAALLISFDGSDQGFKLWHNKAGQVQFGTTNLTSVTSGKVDGSMFVITNGTTLTSQKDADLAFKIKVAQFTTTPQAFKIKNRPYEILKVSNTVGTFIGGEPVYALAANAAGTISTIVSNTSIVGTLTTLTALSAGDSFVITDGTPGNTEVRKVVSVTNTTFLTVDVAPSFTNTVAHFYRTVTGTAYFKSGQSDHLVIQDSTSNSSIFLSAGNTIYGVDSLASTTIANVQIYSVNALTPSFVVGVPNGTTINTSIGFANSSLAFSNTTVQDATISTRILLNEYPAIIASRTIEANTAIPFTSLQSTLTFTTSNPYVSPYVDQENLDMFMETFQINNDDTNEYLGTGNAQTRYISKTINLDANQTAEDLLVYVSVFKPANTNIKVYVKARNSHDIETLDVKNWTELTANTNGTTLSSATNTSDFIEIPYTIPFQPVGTLQSGAFSTAASAVITGTSGVVNTGIAVGDLVRVYSPFAANAYFISTVTAANTTTFTVATAVSNTSMIGSGFLVDVVTRKGSGFLDVQKNNIFTYYNSALSLFQGYDSFALKVILLSDDGYHIPLVNNIRAIAVSA
jgi:hypothetical protein